VNTLLVLAFAAGTLAPVNPCGFALLPAWITHTLADAGSDDASPLPLRLTHALRAGLALTIGFAGTLAAAGLLVSAGARALITAAPGWAWPSASSCCCSGALMLTGRALQLRLPAAAARPGPNRTSGVARLVLFGVGYAAASLSCTLGVLLAVIAQAQATASYTGLLAVFAAYAAGSAAILLLVAIGTAATGAALVRRVAALARHGSQITAVVLVLTGAYLAWYWYPAATGDTAAPRGDLAAWSATASTWISAHTGLIATLATLVVLAVIAAALRHRLRRPHGANATSSTAHPDAVTSTGSDCCPPSRAPPTPPPQNSPPLPARLNADAGHATAILPRPRSQRMWRLVGTFLTGTPKHQFGQWWPGTGLPQVLRTGGWR
jgi:cytochrome c-type biogenesis protein